MEKNMHCIHLVRPSHGVQHLTLRQEMEKFIKNVEAI